MLGMIGKYRLDAELGHGGMGVVYKAYDTVERRTVAIKTIRKGSGGAIDPYVKQFMREAEKLSRLKHENVVEFLEFGEDGGIPYIVMEFVEGVSLSKVLEKREPGEEWMRKTVGMIRVAACALDHVHKEHIVHRDIKPLNIMVDFSGRVVLVDFGIAREIAHGDTLSKTGDRTVEYASPEQMRRGKKLIDGRSDIWSLGVTLYEIAAGELPFGERDSEAENRILNEDPKPLHEVNPAVPRDFETIVMKCLEKERDRRYQAAQGLADDLDRWMKGNPILARPPSVLRRIRKGIAKHRVVFAVALSILLALMIGAALLMEAARRQRQKDKVAVEEREKDEETRERAQQLGQEVEKRFNEINERRRKKDVDIVRMGALVREAQLRLDEWQRLRPEDAEVHFRQAQLHALKEVYPGAMMEISSAVRLDSDNPTYRCWRLLWRAASDGQAVLEVESRLEDQKLHVIGFKRQGPPPEEGKLRQDLKTVLRSASKEDCHLAEAAVLMIREEYEEARKKLEAYVNAWVWNEYAWQLYSTVCLPCNRPEEGVRATAEWLEQCATSLTARHHRAWFLAMTKKWQEAIDEANRVIDQLRNRPQDTRDTWLGLAHLQRAMIRELQGGLQPTVEHLEVLVQETSDSLAQDLTAPAIEAEIYRIRGGAYLMRKKWADAESDFSHAIDRLPGEPTFFRSRAKARFQLGKMNEAEEDAARGPSDAQTRDLLHAIREALRRKRP